MCGNHLNLLNYQVVFKLSFNQGSCINNLIHKGTLDIDMPLIYCESQVDNKEVIQTCPPVINIIISTKTHYNHLLDATQMRKLILIAIVIVAGYFGGVETGFIPVWLSDAIGNNNSDQVLAAAFDNRQSNIQVQGGGTVYRILSDDNDGSRHQRFIVQLASGQTLLIAHNIDLAMRVSSLETGDHIEFSGEYEWNSKGGIIHWTHHDPHGKHVSGWLKHNGHTYQ